MSQSTRPQTELPRLTDHATILVTLAAATVVIARNYYYFLADPRPLWNALVHDRNGHYEFAVSLTLALRGLQPVRFLSIGLSQSKVWPPRAWTADRSADGARRARLPVSGNTFPARMVDDGGIRISDREKDQPRGR